MLRIQSLFFPNFHTLFKARFLTPNLIPPVHPFTFPQSSESARSTTSYAHETCCTREKTGKFQTIMSGHANKRHHFQNRPIFDFKNWQSAGNSFLVLNMFFISSYRLPKVSKQRVCFSILCKIGAKSDEIKRISKNSFQLI